MTTVNPLELVQTLTHEAIFGLSDLPEHLTFWIVPEYGASKTEADYRLPEYGTFVLMGDSLPNSIRMDVVKPKPDFWAAVRVNSKIAENVSDEDARLLLLSRKADSKTAAGYQMVGVTNAQATGIALISFPDVPEEARLSGDDLVEAAQMFRLFVRQAMCAVHAKPSGEGRQIVEDMRKAYQAMPPVSDQIH